MRAADFHKIEFITSNMLDHAREQVQESFREEDVEPIERGEASLSISRLRLVEPGAGLAIIDSQTAGNRAPIALSSGRWSRPNISRCGP